MFWNGCHGLFVFAWILMQVQCNLSDNTPPTIWVENHWKIRDNEPIGSKVAQVGSNDNRDGTLIFGIEPYSPILPTNNRQRPEELPFRIDPHTGEVYLNKSLKGRAGDSIRLYVTAFNGAFSTKAEVQVTILDSSLIPPSVVKISPFPNLPRTPGFLNYGNLRPSSIPPKPPPEQQQFKAIHLRPIKTEIKQSTTTQNSLINTTEPIALNKTINNQIDNNPTSDVTISIISIALLCTVFLVSILLIFLVRKRFNDKKLKGGDDDIRKSSTGVLSQQDSGIDEPSNWRRMRVPSNQYEPWQNDIQTRQHQGGGFLSDHTTDHWEFSRHHLKFFNILGEGAFGQVWKCEAIDINRTEGVTTVAVKTLKENASEKEKQDLISEIKVMKMLKPHQNVVRLLGCCTDKEPIFLIMEYISKGKLQSYLRNSRAERYYHNMHGASKSLTSRDLTSFVYQVARGMEFLTSHGIIHRDLAARNILITEEHTCKVADFGFARDITTSHVYEKKSEGRLPIRWMAPESLYDNIFSVKSDVWSFGILLWEVVTLGSTPYPGMSAAEVMKQVRSGYRLEKPEHCRREIYNIMYYCWNNDPIQRPSFSECVKLLEKLLMTETDYIQLERFPDHSYYNMVSLSGEKL